MALLKSSYVRFAVGGALAGVAALILYFLREEDEDEAEGIADAIKTSRNAVIEVKIPKECVGVVIGRGGVNIKEIQEKTDTKINFKDEQEGDTHRVCVIRGTPETAQYAESLIHEIISNQPLIETASMWVPQKACGRIIGRNGDNIRSMCRASCAKITVESSTSSTKAPTVRILLKGTGEQIELAKSLIMEKVEEDAEIRKKMENLNSRSPRRKDTVLAIAAESDCQGEGDNLSVEKLIAVGSDGTLEVFVSALHSPDCFWVQIKGPKAVDLDVLVDEMTEYYSKDENKEIHAVEKVQLNCLVAALFNLDNKWYRGKVVSIKEDEYDPTNSDVEVYYVDYGDTEFVKQGSLYRLRTDFLTLRFQAIECALARVEPVGGVWSTEAVDTCEKLLKVARWEALTARVETTRTKSGLGHGSRLSDSAHHPIPCIDLYETRGSQDISVAEELVKMGFAEWRRESPERKASPLLHTNGARRSASPITPRSLDLDKKEPNIATASPKTENGGVVPEKISTANEKTSTANEKTTTSKSDLTPARGSFFPPDFSDEGSSDELEMG